MKGGDFMDNKVKVLRQTKYAVKQTYSKVNVVIFLIIAQTLVVVSLLVAILTK